MTDEKIVLFARVKVKPEAVGEAKASALAIVAPSRDEPGCINYDVHQSVDDDTLFFWHETWASKAAVDEHFATPFFQEFAKIIEAIAVEPPQITLTRMISDKA